MMAFLGDMLAAIVSAELLGVVPMLTRAVIWLETLVLPRARRAERRREYIAEFEGHHRKRPLLGLLWALGLVRICVWERATSPLVWSPRTLAVGVGGVVRETAVSSLLLGQGVSRAAWPVLRIVALMLGLVGALYDLAVLAPGYCRIAAAALLATALLVFVAEMAYQAFGQWVLNLGRRVAAAQRNGEDIAIRQMVLSGRQRGAFAGFAATVLVMASALAASYATNDPIVLGGALWAVGFGTRQLLWFRRRLDWTAPPGWAGGAGRRPAPGWVRLALVCVMLSVMLTGGRVAADLTTRQAWRPQPIASREVAHYGPATLVAAPSPTEQVSATRTEPRAKARPGQRVK
jgi:hypothetical protein